MEKIDSAGIVTGIVFIIVSVLLLIVSFFLVFIAIYAVICLVIGIVILLTLKEQDAIEKIKERKEIKRSARKR